MQCDGAMVDIDLSFFIIGYGLGVISSFPEWVSCQDRHQNGEERWIHSHVGTWWRKGEKSNVLVAWILWLLVWTFLAPFTSQANGVIKSFCKNDTISGYSSVLPWSLIVYQLANIYWVSAICQCCARHARGRTFMPCEFLVVVSNSRSGYSFFNTYVKL